MLKHSAVDQKLLGVGGKVMWIVEGSENILELNVVASFL